MRLDVPSKTITGFLRLGTVNVKSGSEFEPISAHRPTYLPNERATNAYRLRNINEDVHELYFVSRRNLVIGHFDEFLDNRYSHHKYYPVWKPYGDFAEVTVIEVPITTEIPVVSTIFTTAYHSSCTVIGQDSPPTPPPVITTTATSTFMSASTLPNGETTTVLFITTVSSEVTPTSDNSSSSSSSSKDSNLGAIIGGAVGGVLGLILFIVLIWYLIKRQRKWDDIFDDIKYPEEPPAEPEAKSTPNPMPYLPQQGRIPPTPMTPPPASMPPMSPRPMPNNFPSQSQHPHTPYMPYPGSPNTGHTSPNMDPAAYAGMGAAGAAGAPLNPYHPNAYHQNSNRHAQQAQGDYFQTNYAHSNSSAGKGRPVSMSASSVTSGNTGPVMHGYPTSAPSASGTSASGIGQPRQGRGEKARLFVQNEVDENGVGTSAQGAERPPPAYTVE
ncbi:hypothetical protein WG66_009158 [Moniliophthora roreri]|nr:hypothetical protein WG66_009158 [Moniliophthora roreri]